MLSVRDALATVLEAVRPAPAEEVPLLGALGRVLARDVVSRLEIPPFPNSQMDGFAVRSADLLGATASSPRRLRLAGAVAAGEVTATSVRPGEALRIMTGAPLPRGADAVVRLEDARETEGAVEMLRAPAPGEFVRAAGEDVRAGETVLAAGRPLRPADIGLLASIGCPSVAVASAPRVALLATGDELTPLGEPLAPGRIYNSNAYALAAAVRQSGGRPWLAPIVRDEPAEVREGLRRVATCDVVLSIGGVSVGDRDYVRGALESLGIRWRFWRVAQKPGRPLAFASRDGQLYFGLPGNPVSALVCFLLYVAPALRKASGRRDRFAATAEVEMEEDVATAGDVTELVRCRLRRAAGRWIAAPAGTQSSGALAPLARADALVVSDPGVERLEVGRRYRALRLDRWSERNPFG